MIIVVSRSLSFSVLFPSFLSFLILNTTDKKVKIKAVMFTLTIPSPCLKNVCLSICVSVVVNMDTGMCGGHGCVYCSYMEARGERRRMSLSRQAPASASQTLESQAGQVVSLFLFLPT